MRVTSILTGLATLSLSVVTASAAALIERQSGTSGVYLCDGANFTAPCNHRIEAYTTCGKKNFLQSSPNSTL